MPNVVELSRYEIGRVVVDDDSTRQESSYPMLILPEDATPDPNRITVHFENGDLNVSEGDTCVSYRKFPADIAQAGMIALGLPNHDQGCVLYPLKVTPSN